MTPESLQSPLDDARQSAKTLVEFAYAQIREQILNGTLTAGSKLKVEVLRAEFGVGASTIREALSLLISDALVTAEGQRGFRVAPISYEDLKDVSNMRKLLECQALRESIANGTEEWEAGIVAAYHRLQRVEERLYEDPEGTAAEWELRNRAFHDALLAGCTSKWLHHFHNILYAQAVRYRRMILTSKQVGRDVRKEHKQILEAVLKRDADLACSLAQDHIERTLVAISRLLHDQDAFGSKPSVKKRPTDH
jgi:GntR family transcriptional regulator, carbon starvation induced regulator